MKRLLLLLVCLLALAIGKGLMAQDMSKFYISKNLNEGEMYFILPHKARLLEGKGQAYTRLSHDFTYISTVDSVTMLMTLDAARPSKVVGVELGGMTYPAEQLYIERRGKWWSARLKCSLPAVSWQAAMLSQPLWSVVLHREGQPALRYGYTEKQWRKRLAAYQMFFDLLRLNREGEAQPQQ